MRGTVCLRSARRHAAGAILAALCGSVDAAVITYERAFSVAGEKAVVSGGVAEFEACYTGSGIPGACVENTIVSFEPIPRFDPALGTLDSVEIRSSTTVTVSATAPVVHLAPSRLFLPGLPPPNIGSGILVSPGFRTTWSPRLFTDVLDPALDPFANPFYDIYSHGRYDFPASIAAQPANDRAVDLSEAAIGGFARDAMILGGFVVFDGHARRITVPGADVFNAPVETECFFFDLVQGEITENLTCALPALDPITITEEAVSTITNTLPLSTFFTGTGTEFLYPHGYFTTFGQFGCTGNAFSPDGCDSPLVVLGMPFAVTGSAAGSFSVSYNYTPSEKSGSPVPEPGVLALVGAGCLGFLTLHWLRRRRAAPGAVTHCAGRVPRQGRS